MYLLERDSMPTIQKDEKMILPNTEKLYSILSK